MAFKHTHSLTLLAALFHMYRYHQAIWTTIIWYVWVWYRTRESNASCLAYINMRSNSLIQLSVYIIMRSLHPAISFPFFSAWSIYSHLFFTVAAFKDFPLTFIHVWTKLTQYHIPGSWVLGKAIQYKFHVWNHDSLLVHLLLYIRPSKHAVKHEWKYFNDSLNILFITSTSLAYEDLQQQVSAPLTSFYPFTPHLLLFFRQILLTIDKSTLYQNKSIAITIKLFSFYEVTSLNEDIFFNQNWIKEYCNHTS